MNKRIALLYFSRESKLEAQEKTWFKGTDTYKNSQLAKSLIEQSRLAIENSGLPIFHFHEGNQKGKTFGERLANAYKELFNSGFESVIAVGNDSPEIHQLNWESIKEDLGSGKNVLGQSIRGGAYLLGINKEYFEKDAFEKLPWQSNHLFSSLLQQLVLAESQVVQLAIFRDINTFFDLKRFQLSGKVSNYFKKIIIELLRIEAIFNFLLLEKTQYGTRYASLRAPPKY